MPGMYPIYPDTIEGQRTYDAFMNARLAIFGAASAALAVLIVLPMSTPYWIVATLSVVAVAASTWTVFHYNLSEIIMTRFDPNRPKVKYN